MSTLSRLLASSEETRAFGRELAAHLRGGDVVVLVGGLGAGKTTLTQGLAEGLKVRGAVTSPTFVISRIHRALENGPDLVHVDAYRLGERAELDDIDLDSDLGRSVTVVEWGAGLAEGLSEDRLLVRLDRGLGAPGHAGDDPEGDPADGTRSVTLEGYGARWAEPSAEAAIRALLGG